MKFIHDALDALRDDENIRVLYACESGSRAWGFASPDSDYDARLIYVHPTDWYLSLGTPRDVLERMLPNDLDLSGWELRKALRLFSKSNACLYEWLGSPVIYLEDPAFTAELRALIPHYFDPVHVTWHYLSTARGIAERHLVDGSIGIKKLFYILRPLFACRWIEHAGTMPPTAFEELYCADWIAATTRSWVDELLQRKAEAAEGEVIAVESVVTSWLETAMACAEEKALKHARSEKPGLAALDELFRRSLESSGL